MRWAMSFVSFWQKYSLILWAVNVLLIVLSYFIPQTINAFLPLSLLLLPAYVTMSRPFRDHPDGRAGLFKSCRKAPKPYCQLGFIGIAYAFINFAICSFLLREGSPRIDDGIYCLWSHGFVREITKAEFDRLSLVQARAFIGHLALFTSIPMLAFHSLPKDDLVC